ncbi:hypothetical protein D8674_005269 [Pyrus ussuriensis x Pyrus communis]|uniref:Uncharacterized protein n=1 Tax=Pyrus ussuriensis x Pyrus communis TaxID=2448454 RepID=A0A5N5FWM7_9ROSA|nr:hypothetical protein D8674_005269 [Pyrus ussuriensis x Pyrus communis]
MDVKCISLAHFLSPNQHAGIPSRLSVLRFRPNCGFVSFLLRCLRRIEHSVAFSSIAALVATNKTFVIPTTVVAAAACIWKLSLLIGLGFMYLIPSIYFGSLLPSVWNAVTLST